MKMYVLLITLIMTSAASGMETNFMEHNVDVLKSLPEKILAAKSDHAVFRYEHAETLAEKLKAKKELEKLTAEMINYYHEAAKQKEQKQRSLVCPPVG